VSYFKYTKKRFGEESFDVTTAPSLPKGYHESKIVTRFGLLQYFSDSINCYLKIEII
jgi:hypothetical protein